MRTQILLAALLFAGYVSQSDALWRNTWKNIKDKAKKVGTWVKENCSVTVGIPIGVSCNLNGKRALGNASQTSLDDTCAAVPAELTSMMTMTTPSDLTTTPSDLTTTPSALTTPSTSFQSTVSVTQQGDFQWGGNSSTESSLPNLTEPSITWETASSLLQSQEHHTSTSVHLAPPTGSPSDWDGILLVSDEHKKLVSQVTDVLNNVKMVVLPVAFILTLCNIRVFLHPRMRSTASKYIVCLSVAQLVTILIPVVSEILLATIPDPLDNYYVWFYTMYIGAYLNSVTRRGTYLCLMLVSTQRLYAVMGPLHVKSFLLSRYPVVFTSAAYVFTAIWHFYLPAKYNITGINNGTNIIYKPLPSSLYLSNPQLVVGFTFATQILLVYFTLVAQLVLSLLTAWALRRHNLLASQVSSSTNDDVKGHQERRMTVTILSATICYVILSVPQAVHFLFGSVYVEYSYGTGRYKNLYRIVSIFVSKLAIISYATDVVVFVAISSNYRAALCQIFGCDKMFCGGKKDSGEMSETDPSTGEIITVVDDLHLRNGQ